MKVLALVIGTLWQRELVRFFRQRSRVIGAVVPPVLFWVLMGSGFGAMLTLRANYLQYFFPGTILLIVLFTSIFSTISLIEDRASGFLQCVLVAPVSRLGLVLGKLLGGASLAFVQGAAFLCVAPLAGLTCTWGHALLLLSMLFLISLGLTALGFVMAWWLESVQGFHAIMNLVLMPMWLLSGALFPMTSASPWMRAAMQANPLTYGLSVLQQTLYLHDQPLVMVGPRLATSFGVIGIFSIVMTLFAWSQAERDS